jgi:hypothetical protein
MPYSLVHDGVLREFDFYAPPGWQHWVGKAWERDASGFPSWSPCTAAHRTPWGSRRTGSSRAYGR